MTCRRPPAALAGVGLCGMVLDMSNTVSNLRYALRLMRRNPGFTLIAVTSLALGIGVNTAIFSLVDQLLLWSIPAREPSRLVKLEGIYTGAYPFYCAIRDRNRVFSSVFASSYNLVVECGPKVRPPLRSDTSIT